MIIEHGEPIVHYVGGTELRIDQPLPAPTKPAAAPAAVAKKESAEDRRRTKATDAAGAVAARCQRKGTGRDRQVN